MEFECSVKTNTQHCPSYKEYKPVTRVKFSALGLRFKDDRYGYCKTLANVTLYDYVPQYSSISLNFIWVLVLVSNCEVISIEEQPFPCKIQSHMKNANKSDLM